jgi:hypothetical protein
MEGLLSKYQHSSAQEHEIAQKTRAEKVLEVFKGEKGELIV